QTTHAPLCWLDLVICRSPVSRLEGVRLVRRTRRLGVAGRRTLGAARAVGEALVFMDSHCGCHSGWLEPLLERVAQDRYPHIKTASTQTSLSLMSLCIISSPDLQHV
uniref:Glycosyltransferase 2-like domain-containing protein n=1 Tax=Hucho hucho TaxID=62062 RepID=A0A4W5QAE2_9TELE